MTFCCKNFQQDTNGCGKLGGECVPGRKGCVLAGEFKLSSALTERIDNLEEQAEPSAKAGRGKP